MEQDGPGSLNPHQNLKQLMRARRGILGNANSSFAGDGKQVLICPRAQGRHKDGKSHPRALHKCEKGIRDPPNPQRRGLTLGIYVIGFVPLNHQLLLFDCMKSDGLFSYIHKEATYLWLYTDILHTHFEFKLLFLPIFYFPSAKVPQKPSHSLTLT